MGFSCPRCGSANCDVARFCARCGLSLDIGVDGSRDAGRIRHPRPAQPPTGFTPCEDAAQLYWRSESSLGGETLIATEGINVVVFNAGYPLRDVALRIRGEGDEQRELFVVERDIEEWVQGAEATLEVPSYELPAPLRRLTVALASAEFGEES